MSPRSILSPTENNHHMSDLLASV
uniref:Uncharacterized protein n=1 Tax=Anguilla anguilla TaxID=7936 RepID=A0A0E9UXV6_ANGAN